MIQEFIGVYPSLDETNFVADTAAVIGDVHLGKDSSVWFSATVRGDVHRIRIGSRTNIQDNAVVHVTHQTAPTTIGDDVTVGHSAIIHGCTVENCVLVGMGAIILDKAIIGSQTIIGAGALVTGGVHIPPRSLVVGSPGRVVRQLTDSEIASIMVYSENYVNYKNVYLGNEKPDINPFYS